MTWLALHRYRRSSHHHGFTLAEVLFATAILSFALLTIIGVMPSTLAELNDAEARITEARIVQSISTEWQTQSWSQITPHQSRLLYYFDSRGGRTDAPSSNDNIEDTAVYAAAVYPKRITTFDQVPGDENDGSQPGQFLTRLNVVITRQMTSPDALGEKAIRGKNKIYAITLANQQPIETTP